MDSFMRRVFSFLLFVVLILLGMHFFPESVSKTTANRFNLNKEANVPTWYSTVLLFSVSASSLFIYVLGNRVVGREQRWRLFWMGFGGVFCFLSLDEAARLHEIIDDRTSVKWVYVYAPFAAVFFVVCSVHFASIRTDDKSLRNWVLGGLIVYALGGLGTELIDYSFRRLLRPLRQTEFAIEEGLEMIGTIMVLMGCLGELRRLHGIGQNRGRESKDSGDSVRDGS
jgi:hypothetical protein